MQLNQQNPADVSGIEGKNLEEGGLAGLGRMRRPDQPDVADHFVLVRHRKVPYTLQKIDDARVQLKCPAAAINRVIMNKDLPHWLMNLPRHVLENQKKQEKEYPYMIRFRVSKEDKEVIEKTAFEQGHASISDYLRALTLGDTSEVRAYGKNRVI